MLKPILRQTNLIVIKRQDELENFKHLEIKTIYILLIASEFQNACYSTESFISKYFPKSIIKVLVANNIKCDLIGSGITFLVSYFPLDILEHEQKAKYESLKIASKNYDGKICISSFLYTMLESITKEKNIDVASLLDTCLGALVLKPSSDNKKSHVSFIVPSELKQSFKIYDKSAHCASSGMLPFTTVSQKLKYQLRHTSLASALPSVKLLTYFKHKMIQ